MIGSQISHYQIKDKLGGGSIGVVYRAEDTRDGHEVAFKFLPFDLRDDQVARDAFVDEAQASSSLEHPNICTIHDIGNAEDGRMFVVMTLYDGETLKQRLESGALPTEEAVRIVRAIADGLAAAHERGIVHRDIKPGNVMLTEDGGVRIVDFGLARVVSHGQPGLTQIGASMGTPTYMSPEQTLGDEVDERSDVWSLGVLFYECLTGELPFDGANLPTVIQAIHSKQPEPPSQLNAEIPASLDHSVLACLAKSRDDRLSSCRDLLDELDRLAERSAAGTSEDDGGSQATSAQAESGEERDTASPSDTSSAGSGGCLLIFAAPWLGLLGFLLL
ncbi:MAG: serine/threonine protein kinase [Thermoanaerobaculia bacterium]|nr:serine/threonine protein kinase [Thermoanaerobaculia bacterium]